MASTSVVVNTQTSKRFDCGNRLPVRRIALWQGRRSGANGVLRLPSRRA